MPAPIVASGRQRLRHRRDAIDHFLPGGLVRPLTAVMPVHLQVAQAEQGLAVNALEARHAAERHFEREGNLTFHFFCRRAREQRNY
jgi:hypothetical protein